MKKLISILIYLSLSSSLSFSQQQDSNLILLIDYNEYTSCEVVEIDGKEVDPNNHFCDDIQRVVDDFSEFFPIKKVFYYDGETELTKDDIILFWDYDFKREIDNLPFSYSKVKINTILNNTILKIKINEKIIDLAPKEYVSDTMIITKKEKNKLVKYTTFISIRNLGLIEKKNVIDNKDWKTKSLELGLDAPIIAEIMPEFEGGQNEFYKYLTKNIKYPTLNSSERINTKLVVEFIIGENGEITMTRILRSINPTFDNQVIELLKNMPRWKPGMNDGKAVPVKILLPVNIDLNNI